MNALVAEQRLREIIETLEGDPEAAHAEADRVLVRLLRMLGYRDVCDLYERVPKWYA